MKSIDPSSVSPVVHREAPEKYGTGFVVHTEVTAELGHCLAYLVTCAHVVTDIGERNMTVRGKPAELVKKPDGDDPDLAVISVVLPLNEVRSLPLGTLSFDPRS